MLLGIVILTRPMLVERIHTDICQHSKPFIVIILPTPAWDGLILIHPIAPAAANSVWLSWSCIYNLFSTRALGFCNLGNVQ